MLYRGMDRAALDAAYDNGAAVGPVKRERYVADRRIRSEAFRERHPARLDAIVAEVRAAVAWTIDHAKELGGDPARVFVAGNSAGGHLTAMAMQDPRVAGGLAISGLYDLEPIRLSYLNDKLRLDPAEAARNSPILNLPSRSAPLIVTVGLDELPELIRQSDEFAAAWQKRGLPGQYLPLAGHDHFSIVEELARPDGRLLAPLRALAGA